jgi:hypothetical protein
MCLTETQRQDRIREKLCGGGEGRVSGMPNWRLLGEEVVGRLKCDP